VTRARARLRLGRAMLWPAATVAGFGLSYALAGTTLPVGLTLSDVDGVPSPQLPVADPVSGRVDDLVERHGCWSGAVPSDMVGTIPGHSVVSLPGAQAAYLSSDVGFAVWTGERDGILHAFCR
jgi:hypothetical protein